MRSKCGVGCNWSQGIKKLECASTKYFCLSWRTKNTLVYILAFLRHSMVLVLGIHIRTDIIWCSQAIEDYRLYVGIITC